MERTYPLRTFAGHHNDIESVAFHGNTSYLATADKTVRLWDITSGKTVRLLLGHWVSDFKSLQIVYAVQFFIFRLPYIVLHFLPMENSWLLPVKMAGQGCGT